MLEDMKTFYKTKLEQKCKDVIVHQHKKDHIYVYCDKNGICKRVKFLDVIFNDFVS
jgi:hypothetical protein